MTSHFRNEIWDARYRQASPYANLLLSLGETAADVVPGSRAFVLRRSPDGSKIGDVMQWGFPPIRGNPITTIETVSAAYWRPWLTPRYRCLVVATSFAEPVDGHPTAERWFHASNGRIMWFAGVWRPALSAAGSQSTSEATDHPVFALLTTAPCPRLRPDRPRRMPVVIRDEELDAWLNQPFEIALKLRRELQPSELKLAESEHPVSAAR